MLETIERSNWNGVIDALNQSNELLRLTLEGDEEAVANAIGKVHSDNTSIITYNNENSLSCIIHLAYYTARNEYSIIREMPTCRGFADFIFTLNQNVNKTPIIFELKFGKSADEAIEQIKARNYTEALKSQGFDKAVLVGVNYDKDTKLHECRIKRISLIDNDN